jgi:hypothetical protein
MYTIQTCYGSKSLKVILIDSDFRTYPVLNPLSHCNWPRLPGRIFFQVKTSFPRMKPQMKEVGGTLTVTLHWWNTSNHKMIQNIQSVCTTREKETDRNTIWERKRQIGTLSVFFFKKNPQKNNKIKPTTEGSTHLTYTGLWGGLQHLKTETKLMDERFVSMMGECENVTLKMCRQTIWVTVWSKTKN